MNQQPQWDDLVSDWNKQETAPTFDLTSMAKKLFWQKAKLAVLILVDVGIFLAMASWLIYGLTHNYHFLQLVWLCCGSIFAAFFGALSTRARLALWQTPDSNLRSWLNHQIRRAKHTGYITRLTNISVVIFLLLFHLWLLFGQISSPAQAVFSQPNGWLIYILAIAWIVGCWLYSRRRGKKAEAALKRLEDELQMLD